MKETNIFVKALRQEPWSHIFFDAHPTPHPILEWCSKEGLWEITQVTIYIYFLLEMKES